MFFLGRGGEGLCSVFLKVALFFSVFGGGGLFHVFGGGGGIFPFWEEDDVVCFRLMIRDGVCFSFVVGGCLFHLLLLSRLVFCCAGMVHSRCCWE